MRHLLVDEWVSGFPVKTFNYLSIGTTTGNLAHLQQPLLPEEVNSIVLILCLVWKVLAPMQCTYICTSTDSFNSEPKITAGHCSTFSTPIFSRSSAEPPCGGSLTIAPLFDRYFECLEAFSSCKRNSPRACACSHSPPLNNLLFHLEHTFLS